MTRLTQTTYEAPAETIPLEEQNGRLLDLVGELVEANQRLRCRVARLEQEGVRTERGLSDAYAVYPMLLP